MRRAEVFIIEDNKSKLRELKGALPDSLEYGILETHSIAQAYRPLENRRWDLIILDMTFQVSLGAGNDIEKEALAGVEILQFISRKRIGVPVIVATQHTNFFSRITPGIDSIEKLDALLAKAFPRNYVATVHVDLAGEAWKGRFQAEVLRALGASV